MKGLEGVGLGKGKEPASEGSRVGKGEMIVERLPRRDAGGQRKRRVEPVYGVQKRADGGSKGVKYSMSHVGVRRRELMYNMVSGEEGDRVKGGWDAGKGAVEAEVEECHGVEFGGKGEAGKEGKVGFGHPDAMEVEEEL